MAQAAWRQPPLSPAEEDDLFMLLLEDDTEDAPWMVKGDLQFWSASVFAHSLRAYAHELGLPWYVASMLLIEYTWPHAANKKKLAPDVFVAFVPERARTSYDVATEGEPPPFVLEVVSPSSSKRDRLDKRRAYDLLGAREYAMFTPREGKPSLLSGYRRGARGRFEPWRPDAEGRLWSEVLGLYLVVRGRCCRHRRVTGASCSRRKKRSWGDCARPWSAGARRRSASGRRKRSGTRKSDDSKLRRRYRGRSARMNACARSWRATGSGGISARSERACGGHQRGPL